MSSPTITPGTKSENAVYLAFGLTISLYLIRSYIPELFDIQYTRELIAAAAFGASLIGAIFFYIKPDRKLLWAMRKWALRTHGTWMGTIIAAIRMNYSVWHVSMMENWPTVMEESEN